MPITNFQQRVYKITALIPKGRVSTYWEIAVALGRPKASRAVGNALNKNPYAPQVPCHRVIRSNGEIGGFASGSNKKKLMLKKEGLVIINNKIDLARYGYRFEIKK
jgi:methylated-DNA-[protein]-cysteine S-methyltransferase